MRRPFLDATRGRWRITVKDPETGRPRKVTLGRTKTEAYERWRAMLGGIDQPDESVHCDCCECRKRRRGPERVDLSTFDFGDPEEFFLSPSGTAGRYQMTERVLLLVELLTPLRRGATLDELHSDVLESIGKTSQRTIRRDIKFLISVGVVEQIGKRFRWVQFGTRATAYASMADRLSDQREVV